MKQIGVGLWTGDPWFGQLAEQALQATERIRIAEELELSNKSPVERFFYLARKTWGRPKLNIRGSENNFVGHDYCEMHFRSIVEREDCFPDLADAGKFMVFLKLFYVVDAYQGRGIGRECLKETKDLAEQSGAAVFLYSLPFGFSKNGETINAFTSLWELDHAMLQDWEVRYWRQNDRGSVRQFYEGLGFQHCWLDCPLGPNDQVSDETGQVRRPCDYIYLPKTLDKRYCDQLGDRLKKGSSQFLAG